MTKNTENFHPVYMIRNADIDEPNILDYTFISTLSSGRQEHLDFEV